MKRQDYHLNIASQIFQNKNWFWSSNHEINDWYEDISFDVPNRSSTTSKRIDDKMLVENRFAYLNDISISGANLFKYLKEVQEKFKEDKIVHFYESYVLDNIKDMLREYGTFYSPLATSPIGTTYIPLSYPLKASAIVEELIAINTWLNTYNVEYKGYQMTDLIKEKQNYVWSSLRYNLFEGSLTNEGFLGNILQFFMTRHQIVTYPSWQWTEVKGVRQRVMKQTQTIYTVVDYLWVVLSLMLIDKSETQICNFRRCKNQYFISTHDRQLFCNKRCQRAETTQRSRDRKREAEINKKGGQNA